MVGDGGKRRKERGGAGGGGTVKNRVGEFISGGSFQSARRSNDT